MSPRDNLWGKGEGRGGASGTHVIPQRHDQDHALAHAVAHLRHAALLGEDVGVVELDLLRLAERVGEAVVPGQGRPRGVGLLDLGAALDVVLLDAGETAARADELGDDGELLARVDRLAAPVEGLVAHAVRVPVAAVRVAVARVARRRVGAAALVGVARVLRRGLARVRGIGHAHRVGLPDVHLGAAGAGAADARVGVVGGGLPSIDVALLL